MVSNCMFYRRWEDSRKLSVCNGVFGLPAGHGVTTKALSLLSSSYRSDCWACSGPALLTRAASQAANFTTNLDSEPGGGLRILPRQSSILTPQAVQLTLIPRRALLPVHWPDIKRELFPARPRQFHEWQRLFRHSRAVHFGVSHQHTWPGVTHQYKNWNILRTEGPF